MEVGPSTSTPITIRPNFATQVHSTSWEDLSNLTLEPADLTASVRPAKRSRTRGQYQPAGASQPSTSVESGNQVNQGRRATTSATIQGGIIHLLWA